MGEQSTSRSLSREASFNFSLDDEDAGSSGTPYRLPRLSPQGDITPQFEPEHVQEERNSPMNYKVWSRYGLHSPQSHVHDDAFSSRSARLEPTPTPISRSDSPAKSVKSIYWKLGHNRNHTFDKTGQSHIQGPYSRELNVTCATPQNWLRMKLGRSKTMLQH